MSNYNGYYQLINSNLAGYGSADKTTIQGDLLSKLENPQQMTLSDFLGTMLTLYSISREVINDSTKIVNDNNLKPLLDTYKFENKVELAAMMLFTIVDASGKYNYDRTAKLKEIETKKYLRFIIHMVDKYEITPANYVQKIRNIALNYQDINLATEVDEYDQSQKVIDKVFTDVLEKMVNINDIDKLKDDVLRSENSTRDRDKALMLYFIGFLRYKGRKTFEDVKSLSEGLKDEFKKYLEKHEYHTKEELAPLIYYDITYPDERVKLEMVGGDWKDVLYRPINWIVSFFRKKETTDETEETEFDYVEVEEDKARGLLDSAKELNTAITNNTPADQLNKAQSLKNLATELNKEEEEGINKASKLLIKNILIEIDIISNNLAENDAKKKAAYKVFIYAGVLYFLGIKNKDIDIRDDLKQVIEILKQLVNGIQETTNDAAKALKTMIQKRWEVVMSIDVEDVEDISYAMQIIELLEILEAIEAIDVISKSNTENRIEKSKEAINIINKLIEKKQNTLHMISNSASEIDRSYNEITQELTTAQQTAKIKGAENAQAAMNANRAKVENDEANRILAKKNSEVAQTEEMLQTARNINDNQEMIDTLQERKNREEQEVANAQRQKEATERNLLAANQAAGVAAAAEGAAQNTVNELTKEAEEINRKKITLDEQTKLIKESYIFYLTNAKNYIDEMLKYIPQSQEATTEIRQIQQRLTETSKQNEKTAALLSEAAKSYMELMIYKLFKTDYPEENDIVKADSKIKQILQKLESWNKPEVLTTISQSIRSFISGISTKAKTVDNKIDEITKTLMSAVKMPESIKQFTSSVSTAASAIPGKISTAATEFSGKVSGTMGTLYERLPTAEDPTQAKFKKVLEEFRTYIKKNGIVFTNRNGANLMSTIEDFVNNLYPDYGVFAIIDNAVFYARPKEVVNDEFIENTILLSPRGQLVLEIDKDRYAYNTVKKKVYEIDASREMKNQKLRSAVRDLAALAMLLPEDASRDYAILNYGNSSIRKGDMEVVKKLTKEEQKELAREQKREAAEEKHQEELEAAKREAELKAAKQQGGTLSDETRTEREMPTPEEEREMPTPEEERREAPSTEEEKEKTPSPEEDDEPKEKEEDEDTNEDVKRMNGYKKASKKLEGVMETLTNAENVVLDFKPVLDRYTTESPLVSLDKINKEYNEAKLKYTKLKDEREKLRKKLVSSTRLSDAYEKYYPVQEKYTEIQKESDLDKIRKSISSLILTEQITVSDKQEALNKIQDYKREQIKSSVEKYLTEFLPQGDTASVDKLVEILTKRFDEHYKNSNYPRRLGSDTVRDSIATESPAYLALKDQESAVSYEMEAKKSEADVRKQELQSQIDPVEMEDKARLLGEARTNVKKGVQTMRDIVDTIHIPKFKGMWKTSLKEVGEGSTSIENLLQRLIDRSTAAVKDIKTRLESTYGISQQPQAPEQQMPERSGYEMRESNRFFGGQLTKQDISDPQAVYKLLLERISKGKEIVSQLQSFLERNTDNAIMLSTNGEPSIFVQLYNKYIEDRADPKKSKLEATEGLMASSEANMVEPTKVLKIDIFDKTVFVALTIFLRLFSLSIMEYLIDKKKVRTMQRALLVYLIAYSILYVGFVLVVNIDTYRTRIIFNYINMHSGISTILGHLIILWLFAMLLFTIMRNIRYIDSPSGSMHNEAITAEDRGNIKYRMSILSGILWIVTTISVAVS